MGDIGKMLVAFGMLLVIVGAILMLIGTFSGRGGWIGTSLLLSLLLTIVFSFFSLFDRR